ncbi:3-(methylthio)propionyl-CoA ligase [Herbaspirillum sp. RTI4]|uniref:3-(methylthio)propionyl-CoA ligase n=1 Tax=Herbaspirillum sp. RTI4 TaxID=3048640 RepID=UPI002AB4E4DA|nr:3-(methylthio)propionyl-CoA ligase [Herbaspirillum sp. RTI4]MDY7578150.1 3-(methylthio)propionyl-CoA ligase [Herbaspirillum sp. RTI4]MEA9980739.1 3-(methylthio)propionyl-CoA ligase [Herbaspirillum sp. RTI4]
MTCLMMNYPLLISSIIRHADTNHGDTAIVSYASDGTRHEYTYADAHRRSRMLANALTAQGCKTGDRIGTLAWNGYRHLELYYAISGSGAVCHTINPRLFLSQIAYIINHADDQLIFFDTSFLKLVEDLIPLCQGVKEWIVLSDTLPEATPAASASGVSYLNYEQLIESQSDQYDWPALDENTASGLCYTSGTTGNPKGVLYSHRSSVLHAITAALPDAFNISARDTVMPVSPMFHVMAWGMPYCAPAMGAKLVLPGSNLDGASLHRVCEAEQVTISAGVPTIWFGLIAHLQNNNVRLSSLQRVVIGGAACPPSLIQTMQALGVEPIHAWGMTETSPLSTVSKLKSKHGSLPVAASNALLAKQGRPLFGVELKIVDENHVPLPKNGVAFGELMIRGAWIAGGYFGAENRDALRDGWFPTGDVATLDADGFMHITDRSKDVIKSGGEWISSIELENVAVAHPAISEAAAVGIYHEKWGERPLLVAVRKAGMEVERRELLSYFEGKVAKWSIPDDVVFVDQLPHTATGKLLKTALRADFREHLWPKV